MRLPRGQTYWRFSVAKAQSAPGSNLGFGNDTAARCRAVSLREVRLVYWTPLRVCGFSPGAKDFASFAVMWYGCRVFRVASVSCCCFSFFLSFVLLLSLFVLHSAFPLLALLLCFVAVHEAPDVETNESNTILATDFLHRPAPGTVSMVVGQCFGLPR